MNNNKSTIIGFVLIFAIMMGFSWYQSRQYSEQMAAQAQLDSIARAEQMAAMAMEALNQTQQDASTGVKVMNMPAYKDALQAKFPAPGRSGARRGRGGRPALSEKDRLIQKYNQLEQDIVTYENNIGFFSMSKNAEPLIKQMQERIAQAKAELETLAGQIRQLKETENQE